MDQDKHLRQIRNTRQNCQADAQNLTYDGAEFNYDNISTIWNGLHKDGYSWSCMGLSISGISVSILISKNAEV